LQTQDLVLGIDLGTSAVKVQVLDASGNTVARATREYPLVTPKPLWSEQDPAHWWAATCEALRAAAAPRAEKIVCVGLTGQMHGLVLCDAEDSVLRPAILWNDQRTEAQCESIIHRVGRERVLQLTGNLVLPGFTAPKIEWVREHEPEIFKRVKSVLLPKDWLRLLLTGVRATDVADASGTSLFDVSARSWSGEMLAALDISEAWLPEVFESPSICAEISSAAAELTGLRAGTPVVAGAGDQAASAVGAGLVGEGAVSATLGTSGVVFAVSDNYKLDPLGRLHSFCHAVPNKWHSMGVVLAAGGSLSWFQATLCADLTSRAKENGSLPFDLMMAEAETTATGAEGLLFLPYLTGERTPHADPYARGAFVGLTSRHTRGHMIRAVVEGVSFALRDSLELMGALGLGGAEVRAAGGGARSPFWCALLADVFGLPVVAAERDAGSSVGVAFIAGVGAGVFADFAETARLQGTCQTHQPDPGRVAELDAGYARYRELYPALREGFLELGTSL
jgi:xylulokinase